jgi:GAF domain-containing protein/HAMP domain-containing protein
VNQWIRSGIFRRIVFSILAVSLIPLLVLGGLALRSGSEAGAAAIDQSRAALDAKSTEALELRAVETANAIANFLEERESDLRSLALLPHTIEAYRAFSEARQGDLWLYEEGKEVHRTVPLYREVTYVDATGQEAINISDGRAVPAGELRDVSDPANTTYKSETYFDEARQLPPGEIYISHVTGFYVSADEFAKGARFSGVLRYAMPVFDQNDHFDGIVVLALDSRHLAEFTEHIVPTEERFAAAPDASAGSYAYLIDDEAHAIAHPNDFLQWGLDKDGSQLPYATRKEELGVLPVRLDRLGFVDENLASIPGMAAQGEAGSIQYYWAGLDKFVAYAPIPYFGGPYKPPAGFGWVGMGADVATFHGAATLVGDAIREKVRTLGIFTLTVVTITGVSVLAVAGLLARQLADPVQRITDAARSVECNEFQLDMLDPLLARKADDEIARLAHVFRDMAAHVQRQERYHHLLDAVVSIGVALPQETDFDRLLETVVLEAQALYNADAGTLLLREDDFLKFVIVRNKSLGIALGGSAGGEISFPPIPLRDQTGAPNQRHICAYTVNTGEIVNVPDAYQSNEFDFSGVKAFEQHAGYRSQSFLGVPLRDSADNIIGMLQLVNARDSNTGRAVAFDPGMNRVIQSLAALGTVAVQAYLREAHLRHQIEQLRIEINEVRKEEQLAQITETEYFRRLQQRAMEIRKRRGESDK